MQVKHVNSHPEVRRAVRSAFRPTAYRLQPPASPRGFTLTELLVVIAIIAILAGLIAAAAVNALKNAKRTRISLEIKNISSSIEEFKTEYGNYPPNGMHPPTNPPQGPTAAQLANLVQSDFLRMFKKAFPRHQEKEEVIRGIAGLPTSPKDWLVSNPLPNGPTAKEAIYFWLGGFSTDEQYPISGTGGPSFIVGSTDGEVLESRNKRFEFDLTRLGPRVNKAFSGRSIQYYDPRDKTVTRQINFWTYTPSGSQQPFVYFDTSRYKPTQYDVWAADPATPEPWIVAFKQQREASSSGQLVFVNQSKFQVLHCGLDDDWGSDTFQGMSMSQNAQPATIYPDGPFIGEIADTLTNFADGTIEDATQK